jgi:mannose/fructose/N-acetylgalactosamine-specific phosphotransferase system component IIC
LQNIEIEVEVPLLPALGIVGVILALSYYFFKSGSNDDESKSDSAEDANKSDETIN